MVLLVVDDEFGSSQRATESLLDEQEPPATG
jgi:hypothetical protein